MQTHTARATHAYATNGKGRPLEPFELERREPGPHDVAIDIKFCGICHSDIHQVRDEWGGAKFPMVPGHEIAGVVSAVGSEVKDFKPGDHVGVGCFVDSCGKCASCTAGLEQYCLVGMIQTYNSTERDGTPTYGGYSESIVVKDDYVLHIPESMPLDATAPLLCAGITLYSPLRHWGAGPGKKVAIVGFGGLGHVGVKVAHALGAEVTVLSKSLAKKDDARRMGADHYYATEDAKTFETLGGTFDLIINTVSSIVDWNAYLGLLKIDGTLVILGVPEKPAKLGAFGLIDGRKSIAGSMIGGIAETQEMLDFCAEHGITAEIEKIPIDKVNEAYDRVVDSDVRYRFVIDIASLAPAR